MRFKTDNKGNGLYITGTMWGEPTDGRQIPLTKFR